jgi:hypothetical protein
MAGSRQVPLGGTGSAQTGDFTPSGAGDVTQDEFPAAGDDDEGPDPHSGTISFSTGAGGGPSVSAARKAKSKPAFNFGFEGLNHYQQRYSRGGTGDNLLGTCGGASHGPGPRTALANWSTRISKLTP